MPEEVKFTEEELTQVQNIQKSLIKSASDLISLDNPNYQFVAARLLLFS